MTTIELLPKQDRFVFAKRKFVAFVAGLGSGKTTAGAIRSILWAQRGDGMIIAPTYPMLRDATQHTFFGVLDAAGIPYLFNKADNEARVFGHRILFRSADHPDRLRGPNMMWAWLDEAAMMRLSVWHVVLGRLRVGETSAWVTTTPAGFNWLHELCTGEEPTFELIHSSTRDNTHLPPDYIESMAAAYTGEFARQEIDGDFVAFEGLVYSNFRRRLHVVDWDPPEDWYRVRAIDLGYTNPFVCLWGAVDHDGRLLIYDEHYRARHLMGWHAKKIREREGRFSWTVADHDAQDVAELRALGIYTMPAKKDVTVGIQRTMARFDVQEDGRPRLWIHERCENTISELNTYQWAPGQDGKPDKEEPIKEHDHAMDALRYMVMQLDGGPAPRIRSL
jgi:phage terminase large subunit